jgi:hypothetical protein
MPFADLAPAPVGALFVTKPGGQSFLSGDLTKVGFQVNPAGADKLELLFGKLDGDAAGAFQPLALMSLVGEFGDDPLGAGFGSFGHPVDVQVSLLSAIPLPASLLMLLSGIGGLSVIRLRRRRKSVNVAWNPVNAGRFV